MTMKNKNKMPKVVMAASVAAMGMGLFSALGNEARATGGGQWICCARSYQIFCHDKEGNAWANSIRVDGATTCTGHEN